MLGVVEGRDRREGVRSLGGPGVGIQGKEEETVTKASRAALKGRSQEKRRVKRAWFVGKSVISCEISCTKGEELLSG